MTLSFPTRRSSDLVDELGDIGRMIADALDVLGHEQKMSARRDVARVLHHVGENLAEQTVVEVVHLLVLQPYFLGLVRSEEHTSELQSLMRLSYAVFCLNKKKKLYSRR